MVRTRTITLSTLRSDRRPFRTPGFTMRADSTHATLFRKVEEGENFAETDNMLTLIDD